ncbi:MAG TPA: addiction module protein [Planctomycetaceae bacterium]|jgi:putative addiction module component (TIGR02574 family)|nr:addiction module protein [Planctomycetaceae bacterium]
MSTRDEIAQQALAVPPDDRAYLAELLEQSLATGEFASPEIAAAWMVEIERRAKAYEQGEMPADDWRAVMSRLKARQVASEKQLASENNGR